MSALKTKTFLYMLALGFQSKRQMNKTIPSQLYPFVQCITGFPFIPMRPAFLYPNREFFWLVFPLSTFWDKQNVIIHIASLRHLQSMYQRVSVPEIATSFASNLAVL